MEGSRRIVGPLIPLLGFLFFIYSFDIIAEMMPGILNHPGNRTARVMEFLMLSTEGMLGLIVEVFATFIVIFVILGAFLEKTGLGALIINTAYYGAYPSTFVNVVWIGIAVATILHVKKKALDR